MRLKILFCLLFISLGFITYVFADNTDIEFVVQTGHSNTVNSVAFSPDGNTLASGSWDKTIKIWDIRTGKVLNTLQGHSIGVNSVVFSPDGKTLASGSGDATIKIWDTGTGILLNILQGHSNSVNLVAFSPDGKTLASGSSDNTIKIWNTGTGKVLNTLQGHSAGVNSVAFSPDGKTLASGSWDNTIKIWDTGTGNLFNTLQDHSGEIFSVAFSPDEKTLVSGSGDETIKIWDIGTGKVLNTLQDHSGKVFSVAFSPDGKTLVSGSGDETIKIWDIGTGKVINTLQGHSAGVNSIAFSPNGNMFASGSDDNTIKIWDSGTDKLLNTLQGHSNYVSSVIFSPDGKTLASGNWDNTIKIWDIGTGKLLNTLQSHSNYVSSVVFSPDGKTLASGSWDNTIKIWDIGTGKLLNTLQGHSNYVSSIAFSPNRKTLASGSWDNTIKIWDTETGKLLNTLPDTLPDTLQGYSDQLLNNRQNVFNEALQKFFNTPQYKEASQRLIDQENILLQRQFNNLINTQQSHYNELLYTNSRGFSEKQIKLYEKQYEIMELTGREPSMVNSVAFSPDGKKLASGNWDYKIKYWDTETGQLLNTLKNQFETVYSVAFSPDGKILASGNGYSAVKIWNAGTGELLNTLHDHSSDILSVAFSPDGKTLASGSKDNAIKIWDTGTGKLLNTLHGHSSAVNSVAFSSNGETLASGSEDCTIRLWDVKTGKLLLVSCGIDKDDYITYSPEFGYYTASEKGAEYASWRINNKFYSVEQYSNVFYRPDLIADIMSGKTVPPPQVNIATSFPPDFIFNGKINVVKENQATLNFNYKGDAPLADLMIILNNNPLDITVKQDTLSGKEVSVTLNLADGQNILKIRALDKNFLKSSWYDMDFDFDGKKVTLYSTAKGGVTTELKKREVKQSLGNYGNKYAVIIGISDYKNLYKDKAFEGLYDLKYADNDAKKFKEFLDSDAGGGNWHTTLLINKDATTEAIDTDLSNILINAKAEDLIYIFFSGHGRSHKIDKSRIYLLTYDFEPTKYTSGYNYSDLLNMVKESKAEHIVVFIDACKCGAISFGKGNTTNPDFGDALKERINEFSKNKVFFTSATGDQNSYEYTDKQMGYFSYFLLEGLNGKAKGKVNSEFINLSELCNYVGNEVFAATSKNEKSAQKPDLIFIEGANFDDYPVAIREKQ